MHSLSARLGRLLKPPKGFAENVRAARIPLHTGGPQAWATWAIGRIGEALLPDSAFDLRVSGPVGWPQWNVHTNNGFGTANHYEPPQASRSGFQPARTDSAGSPGRIGGVARAAAPARLSRRRNSALGGCSARVLQDFGPVGPTLVTRARGSSSGLARKLSARKIPSSGAC